MFRVRGCSCKLFFPNQFDALVSWEGFLGGISPPPELLSQEINVCTAQGEERHPKDYFRTNISHQEWLFKEFYAIGLTWKPSSLAKIGCMALTSLLESSKANTDFSQKVVGYWMHGTCSQNSFESSLRGTVYISLINAEVTKTVTSLLRCPCSSLARNTLSRSDPSCHC